jgi:hypothetical protein
MNKSLGFRLATATNTKNSAVGRGTGVSENHHHHQHQYHEDHKNLVLLISSDLRERIIMSGERVLLEKVFPEIKEKHVDSEC